MKFNFADAPATLKKFEPRLEDHDKQRVKSVRIWMEMNRSSHFQAVLWPDSVAEDLEKMLWDSDENKRVGIGQINYDSVFSNVNLRFVENGSFRVELKGAKIEKVTAKPIAGKAMQIRFQALAIVSDGDLEGLHDILKSNGVAMTAVQVDIPREEDEAA